MRPGCNAGARPRPSCGCNAGTRPHRPARPLSCIRFASRGRRSGLQVTSLSILFLGFLLGMKHATEADHLAAVATLATRQTSVGDTVNQGVAWGIGHTVTLTLFG